jgi:Ca2+-binding EF-hand superfamily protein
MLFDITLNDVFAKFDVNCKKELSWQEFKAFLEVIGYKMTLEEFRYLL